MKKKLIMSLVSLAMVGGLLAGCGDKNEGSDSDSVTVSGIQLKGVYTAYTSEETIDWSKVTLVVNYSDKSSTTITAADIEFDVETPVNENTKAILDTSGLHDLAVLSQEKDYDIKAVLVGDSTTYNVCQITVGDIGPENFTLQSFAKPDFIDVYAATKANAGKTTADDPSELENYFKKGDEIFTVGNMNVFKFIPTVSFMRKGGGISTLRVSNSYKKSVTVEEFVGGEYRTANVADYEVVKEGIKFTGSAASKQFKLTVKPAEFTVSNPAVFEFKVEKGLNIYSAKELGALNLTSVKATDNAGNPYFENLYGEANGQSVSNNNNPIFPRAGGSGYERRDTLKMWREFLKNTGTFSETQLVDYNDAPGYFFMNNIELNKEDIPSEFFITESESEAAAGNLRDGALIYEILSNVEKTINGNYFRVDATKIPLCMSTVESDGLRFISPQDATVNPGHACLFYVPGLRYRTNDDYLQSADFLEKTKPVVFKNINAIGNTGKDLGHTHIEGDDNFKKMAKLTGLICFKTGVVPGQVNNCIAKQFMIGAFANCNLKNYKGAAAAQINDTRIYDCANAGVFNYQCQNLVITNTEMKRFGGGGIQNACHGTKAYYGGYTFVDSTSVIENYITGEEVFFAAVGAAPYIGTLKGLNNFLPFAQFVHHNDDGEYMNLISLCLEDGYMASNYRTYYGGTTLNYNLSNPTVVDLGNTTENVGGKCYSSVAGTLHTYAPIWTVDGSITINPGVEMSLPGNQAAGVLLFNPDNPTSKDPIADIGGPVYPGNYIPNLTGDIPGAPALIPAVGCTNSTRLHLVAPVGNTSLNMIFGL